MSGSHTLHEARSASERPAQWVVLLADDDPFQAFARQNALSRLFSCVERASSAAETLIKLERPELTDRIRLIIVGLGAPGLSGPSFVRELAERAPHLPILVIGRGDEIAPDYTGENVRFLPRFASSQDVVAASCDLLSAHLPWVA